MADNFVDDIGFGRVLGPRGMTDVLRTGHPLFREASEEESGIDESLDRLEPKTMVRLQPRAQFLQLRDMIRRDPQRILRLEIVPIRILLVQRFEFIGDDPPYAVLLVRVLKNRRFFALFPGLPSDPRDKVPPLAVIQILCPRMVQAKKSDVLKVHHDAQSPFAVPDTRSRRRACQDLGRAGTAAVWAMDWSCRRSSPDGHPGTWPNTARTLPGRPDGVFRMDRKS